MNKKFIRYIAGVMAFMMLFASVVFADAQAKQLPILNKNSEGPYTTSVSREDCEKLTGYDKDGKQITYYKYSFASGNSDFCTISTQNMKSRNSDNKTPIYNQDGTVLYYTGSWNLYLYDGKETLPGSTEYCDRTMFDENAVQSKWGTFELSSNQVYCSYFTEEQFESCGGVLNYEYQIDTSIVKNEETGGYYQSFEQYEKNKKKNNSFFKKIDNILAEFAIIIGKFVNWTLSAALGTTLTIDDIVFNRYEEIKLDYFNFGLAGEKVESTSTMVNALKGPINKCYSVFTQIAVIGYVIILVYVGIRMLLSSTSADKKATGKTALIHWCTGVIILFLYPYAMKYIILINDAIVQDIGSHVPETTKTQLVNDGDGVLANVEEKINYANLDPNTNDYMAILGYYAQETLSLGAAFAYLIITWQLVMMTIYYYKRVFTVAFLIMVFPFVALTYVIDKLNDGKSQALSAWTREFVFCVIIQIFHAAVYVFVVSTIRSTIESGNMDTILLMIAATFMFEGENILKQIFGGNKTIAVGSPAQNAVKMAAIAGMGLKVAKGTIKTTGKAINATGAAYQATKTGILNGARIAGDTISAGSGKRWGAFKDSFKNNSNMYKNFSRMNGGFERAYERNNRNMRIAQILPSSGNITADIQETAESIDLINNGKTPKDVGEGLNRLRELMKKRNSMTAEERRQFDAMMQECDISADQFLNIQNGINTAYLMAGRGEGKKRIDQHLKFTVEYSFSNLSGDEKKKMVGRVYAATMYNMRAGYVDKDFIEKSIEDDWNQKRETIYNYGQNAKFRNARVGSNGRVSGTTRGAQRVKNRADGMKQQFETKYGKKLPNNVSQQEFDRYINSASMLEQVDAGEHTATETIQALQILENGGEAAKQILEISNLNMSIEELKYVLARKIADSSSGVKLNVNDPNQAETAKAVKWANETIENTEKAAANYSKNDPATSIYDIINAAKANGDGNISGFEQLYTDSAFSPYTNDKVKTVVEKTKEFASETLKEILDASSASAEDKALAKEASTDEPGKIGKFLKDTWNRATNDEYDSMTVNGYTYYDMMKMKNANAKEHMSDAASVIGDTLLKPTLAFLGAVTDMALTDDGMPLGEAAAGAAYGASTADSIMGVIPNSKIAKEKNDVKDKVGKRLKKAEKDMLIARGESSESNINELRLTLISGNRYENADGDFHVTLKIIAENATYMSIGESNYLGPWVPYVEDYDYELKNSSAPNIYVRLRDSSGNIINSNVPLN